MISITSSHSIISLPATSSASLAKRFFSFADDDKHDGMLEVFLPCAFYSPSNSSFIAVRAGRILPSSCFCAIKQS